MDLSSIARIAALRRLRSHYWRYIAPIQSETAQSPEPVTLLMPVHPKDADRLVITIPAIKRFLAHPIEDIVIISPPDAGLRNLAGELGATFVDERDVLPENVANFVCIDKNGRNRNGWIRQQYIKLSWPQWLQAQRVVTIDSDTRPVRPLRFIDDAGRTIFYTSDEYSRTYFEAVTALLGPIKRAPWSFVAHKMMFERAYLQQIYEQIAGRSGKDWCTTVLESVNTEEPEFFSEFELYGNYMFSFHREKIATRYWMNKKISPADFAQPETYTNGRYLTVSSHVHPHQKKAQAPGAQRRQVRNRV